jgi:hypothetical protein
VRQTPCRFKQISKRVIGVRIVDDDVEQLTRFDFFVPPRNTTDTFDGLDKLFGFEVQAEASSEGSQDIQSVVTTNQGALYSSHSTSFTDPQIQPFEAGLHLFATDVGGR